MIHDFDSYDHEAVIQADICVIGSGAAGLTIANQFFDTGWKVVVLEGGGPAEETSSRDLYQADVVGLPHDGVHEGRFRVLGGSTTAWGGQLLPLCEADFNEKPWLPFSGWPLSFENLEPFYRRAETMMGVDGPPYDEDRWRLFGITPPTLDGKMFHYRFSQWAAWGKRNLALSFRQKLKTSQNVDVIVHANAVNVLTNKETNHVDQVDIRSFSGKAGMVKARFYVICCGGIETPRLLLASNTVESTGVGNKRDLVGRYFQDHISLRAGRVVPIDRRAVQALYDPFFRQGVMYTPKIEMSRQSQQEFGLLNAIGHLKFEIPEDSSLQDIKRMLLAVQAGKNPIPSGKAMLRMVRDSQDFARLAFGKVALNRRLSLSRGDIYLLVDTEQAPNPQSRILLSEKTDGFGMPRVAVDWRLSEIDVRTLCTFARLFKQQWARLNLGEVLLDDLTFPEGQFWRENMRDVYHHMGTTRMGDTPQHGVVDKDCKVHSVDNLFIGGSAVFPTSGNSNPTLTIMALCLRLSDHLKSAGPV